MNTLTLLAQAELMEENKTALAAAEAENKKLQGRIDYHKHVADDQSHRATKLCEQVARLERKGLHGYAIGVVDGWKAAAVNDVRIYENALDAIAAQQEGGARAAVVDDGFGDSEIPF
jgi:hypothetical protein